MLLKTRCDWFLRQVILIFCVLKSSNPDAHGGKSRLVVLWSTVFWLVTWPTSSLRYPVAEIFREQDVCGSSNTAGRAATSPWKNDISTETLILTYSETFSHVKISSTQVIAHLKARKKLSLVMLLADFRGCEKRGSTCLKKPKSEMLEYRASTVLRDFCRFTVNTRVNSGCLLSNSVHQPYETKQKKV